MVFLQNRKILWKICIISCLSPLGAIAEPSIKEKAPTQQIEKTPSSLPDDFLYEGAPIDPFCFRADAKIRLSQKSLAQCTQEAKTQGEEGRVQKGKIQGFANIKNSKTGKYLYYQYLGPLFSGGHLIYKLRGDHKKTGRFSSIDFVKRTGDELSFFSIDGGDRSFGAISAVSFKDGILKYTTSLTPIALFDLWQRFIGISGRSNVDFSTLRHCPSCTIAKIDWAVPESSLDHLQKPENLVKISLICPKEPLPPYPKTLQECFDFVCGAREAQGTQSLSLKDLNDFFEQIISVYSRHNL